MLSADRAAFCCVSQLLTEECPFLFFLYIFFFNLTYNCHCFDCRAITCTHLQGAIDTLLAVKAPKPPDCSINLSLTANLSLIIGSWHLWRGGEIDSGGWVQSQRWLFREPIYNDSQQEGALLTFIYKGGPAHHSPEVLFICLANPITLVLIAAGKQLYLHSPCLSGSVSICFWTARWSSLFNFTGSSFGLSPFKETNEFPIDV